MKKLYRIDVRIYGTAYIRASSSEDALRVARSMGDTAIHIHCASSDGVEISGADYAHVPDVSLSPAMTIKGPDDGETPEPAE